MSSNNNKPLRKSYKKLLDDFQCDYNRQVEENFAQMLAERSDIRLFFINENECFTDGKNIIIDPALNEIFADKSALLRAEDFLKLDNSISSDPWLALKMSARATNIHESLHIIYSNFPVCDQTEERTSNRIRSLVLSLISNIIEDSFIEAVGCSVYDNLEHFLLWSRVALCFTTMQSPRTIEHAFEKLAHPIDTKKPIEDLSEQTQEPKVNEGKFIEPVMAYLEYMASWLLYPFLECLPPPEELKEYVENTKQLFSDAAVCGIADTRYTYVQKVFDIIEPIIPECDTLDTSSLENMLNGMKTHAPENTSIANYSKKGRNAVLTRRLFTDKDGKPISHEPIKDKIDSEIKQFLQEKQAIENTLADESYTEIFTGMDFDCSSLHKNISIEVRKPKVNRNLRKSYQNTVNKYKLSINSYIYRLGHLLKGHAEEIEDKKLFGSGISSKHFSDIKRRYWYKRTSFIAIPDISFLFLIDGSGSMEGNRRKGAMDASIIIHEILKVHEIKHAIVEHRAIYGEPLIEHNILVDFNAKADEKYNLLTLDADEGTREGLTLYWAEKYLTKEGSGEYKIIIIISDGAPQHSCDDPIDYEPPISIKDTANAAKKIIRHGIPIIAIALDNAGQDCYRQLKQIYPNVVSCTAIDKLAGQLLSVVSKSFQGAIK